MCKVPLFFHCLRAINIYNSRINVLCFNWHVFRVSICALTSAVLRRVPALYIWWQSIGWDSPNSAELALPWHYYYYLYNAIVHLVLATQDCLPQLIWLPRFYSVGCSVPDSKPTEVIGDTSTDFNGLWIGPSVTTQGLYHSNEHSMNIEVIARLTSPEHSLLLLKLLQSVMTFQSFISFKELKARRDY